MTSSRDPARMLQVALEAAREAGGILMAGWHRPKGTTYKSEIDPVTIYDRKSETAILTRLRQAFPDHAIVAEESGDTDGQAPWRWFVDPLDGTMNYSHGFPCFSVSIAVEGPVPEGRAIWAGVVHDPLHNETFSALRGAGAHLNGEPLSVTDETVMSRALLASGFPYDIHQHPEPIMTRFARMIAVAQGVRRAGSAALDLAYVAAGRLDGYWEDRLHAWDTAAGQLLVREAGGIVTDFQGRDFTTSSQEILATGRGLYYTMCEILRIDPHGPSGTERPKGVRE